MPAQLVHGIADQTYGLIIECTCGEILASTELSGGLTPTDVFAEHIEPNNIIAAGKLLRAKHLKKA